MIPNEKSLYFLMVLVLIAFFCVSLHVDGLPTSIRGFLVLQQHPARLLTDFTVVGGVGGAFLNAFVMGSLALGLVYFSDIRLSGPTISAVFTILGFSLFGKTPLNALPIVVGVYLATRIAGKPFKNYILIAMFGTALGPLVTFLAAETGWQGIPALGLGLLGGLVTGIILPGIAIAMLRMHEGYNLYNIGLTSGFLGLFAAAILSASGHEMVMPMVWNTNEIPDMKWLVPILSVLLVVWGVLLDRQSLLNNAKKLLKLSGRLPSDFMENVSPGVSLVNAGLLGMIGSGYMLAIGADFNGPTLGGLMTVMGFATFGKHLGNCWPVALGVIGGTLLFGKPLNDPGPLLALMFGTTLAPLAGEFGPAIGGIAGFLHLTMVLRTATWHGGMDLYNNGFAGGLTATFMIALIQWFRSNWNR